MTTVFLGGTCNETDWRDKLIEKLTIDYFNPVITGRDWTEEDRQNEIRKRQECEFVLYVFTPRMTGLYSIAEVIDDSNKRPGNTVMFVQEKDVSFEGKSIVFTENVKHSMENIAALAKANGAKICYTLDEVAEYLNAQKK